jgi:hypothetical protein
MLVLNINFALLTQLPTAQITQRQVSEPVNDEFVKGEEGLGHGLKNINKQRNYKRLVVSRFLSPGV